MFEYQAPTNLFDTFMAPLQRQQQLGINQQAVDAQTQEEALKGQEMKLQLQAMAQKQAQEQQYQQDVQGAISNPSPDTFRSLMLKYPDQHDALKQTWDSYDSQKRERDLAAASSVGMAIQNGRPDLAQSILEQRKQALDSAGENDGGVTDAMIQALQSGDPAKIKQAQGMAQWLIWQADPDKAEKMFGGGYSLQPGETRYDAMGNVIAESPYLKVGGGILAKDGTPSSTANPAAVSGGSQASIDHVLGNEGGYNPKDMNGSPTNFGINFKANEAILKQMGITPAGFKNMTKDQAEQIYAAKYWPASGAASLPANLQAPYFDVYIRSPAAAKRFLAQSNGDPVTFAQLSSSYFAKMAQRDPNAAKYAKAWANRDAGNMAIASGQAGAAPAQGSTPSPVPGYHWIVPPGGGGQYHVLTDAEVKAQGLDPGQQYQLNTTTGQVTGLGQKTGADDDVLAQYKIAPTETGQPVLTKLPATMASQVKALAEGRMAPPTSTALARQGAGAAYWRNLLALTYQYDPTYDQSTFPERKAAILAFTGMGKGAQLVGSANRVANHLEIAWDESQKLAGPNTGFGPTDTAIAAVGQSFERPDATAYDNAARFVAGELGKLSKAGIATEGEVNGIIANLDRHNARATRDKAMQTAVGIISGAIEPLKTQYESAFPNGVTRPNIPWITPKARAVFNKIGTPEGPPDLGFANTNETPTPQTNAPPSRTIGGKTYYNIGGKWFDNPEGR